MLNTNLTLIYSGTRSGSIIARLLLPHHRLYAILLLSPQAWRGAVGQYDGCLKPFETQLHGRVSHGLLLVLRPGAHQTALLASARGSHSACYDGLRDRRTAKHRCLSFVRRLQIILSRRWSCRTSTQTIV